MFVGSFYDSRMSGHCKVNQLTPTWAGWNNVISVSNRQVYGKEMTLCDARE